MKQFIALVLCVFFVNGVSDDTHQVSKREGESVTLHPRIVKTQQDRLKWYFNHSLIVELNRDKIKICVEDQCKERFRDRLKLDIQTGSLTIMNIRTTDTGDYQVQINGGKREESFNVTIHGSLVADASGLSVPVVDGDSVTLHTGVQTNPNDRIRWYFKQNRIAEIKDDQSKICPDKECPMSFKGRLDLNNQTGSVTIRNITTTDSGDYQLVIHNRDIGTTFSVTVLADQLDRQKSVLEKESVTLETHAKITPNDEMKWFFNEILIAEITGSQSGKGRLKDRLKLDDQTGSLTITNITAKDHGEYTLQINHSTFSINRSFTVVVTAASGTPPVPVIVVVVVLLLVTAAVVVAVYYYCKKKGRTQASQNNLGATNMESINQQNGLLLSNLNSCQNPAQTANGTSHLHDFPLLNKPANQTSDSGHNTAQTANETSHNQNSPLLSNSAIQTSDNCHNPAQIGNETSHNQDSPSLSNSAIQTSDSCYNPAQIVNGTSHNQDSPSLSNSAIQTSDSCYNPAQNVNGTSHNQDSPLLSNSAIQTSDNCYNPAQIVNGTSHNQNSPLLSNSAIQTSDNCHNPAQIGNETSHNQDSPSLSNSAIQTSDSCYNPAQIVNGTSHNQDSPSLSNSAIQTSDSCYNPAQIVNGTSHNQDSPLLSNSAIQTSDNCYNPAQIVNGTSHTQDSPLLSKSANRMSHNFQYIGEYENEDANITI